ncbi:sperm equatorial segment protein 1-like [Monodelphis domestica]|uniref:sperm equatorial segment protein 1-like n=1 Tax=Monodelphis domestica TaxID=13616 RepID=UPI0000F2E65C|nr:sperm equatorial segment protein 1-like [Monodelphis domestica]
MSAKAAVLLAMLWLRPLPVIAYYMQVTSSNLSVEDRILRNYSEILKEVARRVPTSSISSKGQAATTSSNWKREMERVWKSNHGSPQDALTASTSQSPNREMVLAKIKLKSAPQLPRNPKDTHRGIPRSGGSSHRKAGQGDSSMRKAVALALDLLMKLSLEPIQETSEQAVERSAFPSSVKVGPKEISVQSAEQKEPLDVALQLLEEAYEGVKRTTPGERVSLGQIPLVTTLARNHPEAQENDLELSITQPSHEARDQEDVKRVLQNQILKKIEEIKQALQEVRPHLESKDDTPSAKEHPTQGHSLANTKNTSSNGHKPQKLAREKNDGGENTRMFINFLYHFKPKLNTFFNMKNIPSDLQGKAAIIFSMMSTILCQYQPDKANVKDLLEYNIKVLNMLNITAN